MSATTHVQRCREWIQEQVDAMGTLRTANTRDLSFKSWRQNTVTALQRIWPEDRERIERFRRIVFTPPHSRADAKLAREWFGKGIGESRSYLNSLLDVIDQEGVPAPAEADRDRDTEAMEAEVGFPMLDLSAEAAPPERTEAPATPAHEAGGLDVTTGYTTPDDQGATRNDPRAPSPPSLQMRWQAPTPSELRRREGPLAEMPPALGESDETSEARDTDDDRPAIGIPRAPSLPPAEAAPPARREPPSRVVARGKNGRGKVKKAAPKPKLKDLLGLDEFDSRAQESAPEAAPAPPAAARVEPVAPKREPVFPLPPQRAAAPVTPTAPVAAAPPRRAAAPVTPTAPVTPAAPPPAREESPAPAARMPRVEAVPAPVAAPEPAVSRAPEPVAAKAPEPVVAKAPEPVVARAPKPVEAEAPKPAAAEAPKPAAAEVPAPPAEEDDEQDRERATLDFMQNSPVFGVVGKPVQRRTDTTEFLDPDAVAVATLAADLGRFGVPDGMKASLAARLVDVARRLEGGDLDWPLLRGAVTDAMQYPELARRLLPILLPWLERAA